jgi:hypothetical protein
MPRNFPGWIAGRGTAARHPSAHPADAALWCTEHHEPGMSRELNAGTVRFAAKGLMALVTVYSALATHSLWQASRSYLVRGQQLCAVLHDASASTRSPGAAQTRRLNESSAAWSVEARYSYQFSGKTYAARGVWPWGPGADKAVVLGAVRDLRAQQAQHGCVSVTVDSQAPERAVLFTAPLSEMMRQWLLTPILVFAALLAVDGLSAWFERRQAAASS